MKVKIFKCIMNGENAVECSLHLSFQKAAFAAAQFVQTFDDKATSVWEESEIDTEESLGRNDEFWDDDDWGMFFALYIGRIQNSGILGVNTVTVEAEEVEVPDVKPMHGLKGERIGVMDVTGLSEKSLAVIRNFAWKCEDEDEPDFNFYHCDENCFWENIPENYRMSEKTRTELNRFLAFMSANNCWWARFIEW